MRRGDHGQLPLRWEQGLRTQGVPDEAEQKCLELLQQLLGEVVGSEREREIRNHEREDQPESS